MVQMEVMSKIVEQNLPTASSTAESKTTTKTWTETIETSVSSINITTTSTTIVTVTTTISPKRSHLNCNENEDVTSCTKSTENGSSIEKGSSVVSALSSNKNSWDIESNGCSDSRQVFSPSPSLELDVLLKDDWKMGRHGSSKKAIPKATSELEEKSSEVRIPDHVDFRPMEKTDIQYTCANNIGSVNTPSNFHTMNSCDNSQFVSNQGNVGEKSVPLMISTGSYDSNSFASPTPKIANSYHALDGNRNSPCSNAGTISGKALPQYRDAQSEEIKDNEGDSQKSSEKKQEENLENSSEFRSTITIDDIIKKIRRQIDVSTMKRRSLQERRKGNSISSGEDRDEVTGELFEQRSVGARLSIMDDLLSIMPQNASVFKSVETEDAYQTKKTLHEPNFLDQDNTKQIGELEEDCCTDITTGSTCFLESGKSCMDSNYRSQTDTSSSRNILHTLSNQENEVSMLSCSRLSNQFEVSEESYAATPNIKIGDGLNTSNDVSKNCTAAGEIEECTEKQTIVDSAVAESEVQIPENLQQTYDLASSASFDSAVLLLLECSQTSFKVNNDEGSEISTLKPNKVHLDEDIQNEPYESVPKIDNNASSVFRGSRISQILFSEGVKRSELVSSDTMNTKSYEDATEKIIEPVIVKQPMLTQSRSKSITEVRPMLIKSDTVNAILPAKNNLPGTSRSENKVKNKSSRSKGSFFGFGLFNKKGKVERRKSMPGVKRLEVEMFPSTCNMSFDGASELSASSSLNRDQGRSLLSQSFSEIESECVANRQFLFLEPNDENSSSDGSQNEILGYLDLLIRNKVDAVTETTDDKKSTDKANSARVAGETGTDTIFSTNQTSTVQSKSIQNKQADDILKSCGDDSKNLNVREFDAISEISSSEAIPIIHDTSNQELQVIAAKETISTSAVQEKPSNENHISALDPALCIKYVLRLQTAVKDSLLTDAEAEAMTNLPRTVMQLIVYHFELCDSNDDPIDWDAMQKLVSAFAESNDTRKSKAIENQSQDTTTALRSSIENDIQSQSGTDVKKLGILVPNGPLIESPANRRRNFI